MQRLRNITESGTLLDWVVRLVERWVAGCPSARFLRAISEETARSEADAKLVSAALTGRADAVESLVCRVKPEIFKVARAMAGTQHDNVSLSEKIFLRIFQLLKTYRPEVPLADWSIQAAVSTGICELNSPGWAVGAPNWTEDDARLLEAIDAGSDCFESAEATQLLDRMLDRLSPAERLVKRFHDLEDHSLEEIRKWTGWSETKVRKTAESAKKRMDDLLVEICSTVG